MLESVLKFVDYKIGDINFKLKKGFVYDLENIEIATKLKRNIIKGENGQFQLNLYVTLGSEDNNQPFILQVELMAIFETESDIDMLVDNATAIMYPYLRNVITGITSICNIPPIVLPVININKMFEDQE